MRFPWQRPATAATFAATLVAVAAVSSPSLAQDQDRTPRFASPFGSDMVLPYGRPLELRGTAGPGAALTLSAQGRDYEIVAAADGRWRAEIAPLAAGGPYELRLRDRSGQGVSLSNVLAGEVWLCSGQSNMAYSVAASIDQPAEYAQPHASIRLLTVPQRTELQAREHFAEPPTWQTASTANVPRFSAVCYFAARKLFEHNAVPLGLINASWGGAAIEAWVSERGLATVPGFERKVRQLAQYRGERRAAELAFAADWVEAWRAASDQGLVWERGVLDAGGDWRPAPLVNWKTYPDERLANHHGMLWFSTRFELTADQRAKPATFVLGKIDEVDTTWINGTFVQNSFGYGTKREYPLEPGVLVTGTNQITVNVLNTWDAGGLLGPAEEVGIRFADGEFVALGGGWQYRYVPRDTAHPPRSPWESVAGVTGMFNGMIAPLAPLKPAGVIWYQGESNAEKSASYEGLLTALVADWRRHFADPALPFVIVQLPNYGSVPAEPADSGWATIRAAQQRVALADEHVGLVVTHDAGDDADIHPRRKFVVGARAADVALALRGSHAAAADGVVAAVAGLSGPPAAVTVAFEPPLRPIATPAPVAGFELCPAPSSPPRCLRARVTQTGSTVAVEVGALPARLRYCWSDGGQCALETENGLPVSSFELDLPGGMRPIRSVGQ